MDALPARLLLAALALAGCTSGSDQRGDGAGAGYTNGTAYNHSSYGYPTTNGTADQNATVTGTGTGSPQT